MRKGRLAIVAGLALAGIAASKAVSRQKSEWHGISESEARAKLDSRLPSRIPEERRTEIADKVVAKMRERGVLGDVDVDLTADDSEVSDATESADT